MDQTARRIIILDYDPEDVVVVPLNARAMGELNEVLMYLLEDMRK